jgi:hypothetical protein
MRKEGGKVVGVAYKLKTKVARPFKAAYYIIVEDDIYYF